MKDKNREKAIDDLINNNAYECYDFKNVTIFFSIDKAKDSFGKIQDIVVEYTPRDVAGNKVYERNKISFGMDIGNSSSCWNYYYNLSTLLIILFLDYGFVNKKIGEKAIMELFKIKEFKKELAVFITGAFNSRLDFSEYESGFSFHVFKG